MRRSHAGKRRRRSQCGAPGTLITGSLVNAVAGRIRGHGLLRLFPTGPEPSPALASPNTPKITWG
ncbi:hypothetical protein GCM10023083_70610 [Streptomyces phyllanthi]